MQLVKPTTEWVAGSPETRPPLVVTIVVNYRGRADTANCLRSLLAADYANHEIVVVDNASGTNDASDLQVEFAGRIALLETSRNLGYGGAANVGLQFALERQATYAWVLNNDTVVGEPSIAALVKCMEREPDYGATSPIVEAPVGPESPFGVWYAGGEADASRAHTSHGLGLVEDSDGIVPTGFVTGCSMFLRVDALRVTGLFWPELFLYWEDVDLSYRLVEAGWRLGFVPSARICHLVHGSVLSAIASYYYYRNAPLVARRHDHARGAITATAFLSARVGRRWAACLVKGRRPFPVPETRGLLAGIAVNLRGLRSGTEQ
jgi:GT2 family glycosyltransferase